ncbi:FtsX-like permease family protein [Herbidospora cretacea]|uniref:FtsX-like permease family protein n=1 Tax=Herbidospora cretacea TaxID=28444 RepID=UPI0004C33FDB|nr:FtsX-like permease family protein [Herbidospora cretacea]
MRGRIPLVLRRALSQPLLLVAAFGSILLATTALVALIMYAVTVAEVGVRRTMETAPIRTTSAKVTTPVDATTFPQRDALVRERLAATYGDVPAEVTVGIRSDSYAMPGQEKREQPELTRFATYEHLDRHAELVEGAWPAASTSGPVEVVVSQPAAQAMNLTSGATFTIVGRLDDKPVDVRVSGIFRLTDPYSDRWNGDELLRRGAEIRNYTTYGPLMVAPETFVQRFATNVTATWFAVPDLRDLPREELRPFAGAVAALNDDLKRDCSGCAAVSNLPEMLAQLDQAALVARSTMLVPVLQLLVLAAYALMLTARLLADHRRMEVALLRSRGAGSLRLGLLAGAESLLVALPCAIVAPFLAPPVLTLVGSLPWLRATGVRLTPTPDLSTFLVSAGVAVACAVLLALPAWRGARRTYIEEQSARGRGEKQGIVQRAGGDLVLLVVAALAVWQLQRYGSPVTSTTSGALGIDPLIVTGPALALLCGGMLGLRLVPIVSGIAERWTSRRSSLAPALGAWQVSRRPLRYSGPVLLLTMAIAIGVVSIATAATWRGSQEDQARHIAAADLRVAGPVGDVELGPLGRAGTYAALPGVTGISPVYRGTVELGGDDAVFLAADAGRLDGLLHLRPDLTSMTVPELAGELSSARPDPASITIPGEPGALTLGTRLTLGDPARADDYRGLPLRLVVRDRLGTRTEVWTDLLTPDGRPHQVRADLKALGGRSGAIAYPLTVEGVLLDVPIPPEGSPITLTVDAVTTDAGTALEAPSWTVAQRGKQNLDRPSVTPGGFLTLTTGRPASHPADAPFEWEHIALLPGPAATTTLPVAVTADLAAGSKLVIGKTTTMAIDGTPTPVTPVAVLDAMPGTEGGQPAVLADLETVQARDLAGAYTPHAATEWWLAADGPRAEAEMRRHIDWDQTIVSRTALTRQLQDDPLASGLQGALILGFAAALVFAVLGFLVNAAVAARERTTEFALLRALGVSFNQVFGLLAVEQTFIIGLSLVGGTALAVAVATLVVPHIVLTGQATAVTPGVLLDIPWGATAALLAAVALLLFAVVGGLARTLRRQGLGRALRIGED